MSEPLRREVEIFNAALEVSSEAERKAYVARVCAGDDELRRKVEALLRASAGAEEFFQPANANSGPGGTISVVCPVTEKPGDRIGRYKLLEQIGEGGCGVVYVAEQAEPIRRRVALKVIKLGMDTKQVVARFEAERQALALMDHHNIAKVLDAGATETGRPYFVMELVRGSRITDYCDQNRLPTAQRLDLFIQVCHAIQHAHQKGVIHRDIKPSNILVTVVDGQPVPKVIDFGIAKAIGQQLTDKTVYTAFEQFIGTPAYMSPEQAQLSGVDVDTRSDIYSLGVLLYELLTGHTPFDPKTLVAAGLDEMRRVIRETDPPKPSTRLSTLDESERTTVAKRRQEEPGALRRLMRGDLDWIVMKCLEKNRARRYETTDALALDLQRHLNHEVVAAVAPSVLYLCGKFVRRHKLGLSVFAAIGLLLVAGIAVSTSQMVRANRHAAHAREAADALAANLYAADVFLAQSALQAGDYGLSRRSLTGHLPRPGGRDLRGFEWAYLWRLCQGDKLAAWKAHENSIRTVAVSPDGTLLASTSSDHEGKLWDAQTRQLLLRLEHADCAAFSPDGQLLFTAGWNGRVQIWEVSQKRQVRSFSTGTKPWEAPRAQIAVSPTQPLLAVSTDGNFFGGRGSVSVYDYQSGVQISCLTNCGNRVAFSPDGKLLVTGSSGGCITVWEVATSTSVAKMSSVAGVSSLAVSPDGGLLATTEFWSGDIRLWDMASGKELPRLRGHPVMAWQVTFSPDGKTLASCSADQKVNLWDVATRRLRASMIGHQSEVHALAFAPDGQRLFTGSKDETIAVWPTQPRRGMESVPVTRAHENPPLFSPDGRLLAVGTGQGEAPTQLNLWELGELAPKAFLTGEVAAVWFSPDAKVLTTYSANGEFHFWDVAAQTIRGRVALSDTALDRKRLTASKDGRLVAGLAFDDSRQAWVPSVYEMQSGLCQGQFRGTIPSVVTVEISPDGRFLATGGDRMVEFWDVRSGKLLRTSRVHKDGSPGFAFSPQGSLLATHSTDGFIKLWSVPDGQLLATLSDLREAVMWAAFSPDGQTLATAGSQGWVKLWHVATRRELASFKHDNVAWFTRFSPDGRTLAIAPGWGRMFLLRAPSLAEVDAQQPGK